MADISWSAYALAMFTPEQREAAVNAQPDPGTTAIVPLPPINYGVPVIPSGDPGSGTRVTIGTTSYDTNNPIHLRIIYDLGWSYFAGQWRPPSAPGIPQTIDQIVQSGGALVAGVSTVVSASFTQGMSVLGTTVPNAPPVLLPSWVGGRVGVIRIGEGMRPESGGEERFIWGERILPLIIWD